ncbi:helix-turn-helix domain-containing protein [Brevundimonas sp. NPDC003935]|uniref:helix-turn-helix domain-containing protein n=1 Tax=unclassified Brevundimonas TaxID=2622653 RepID=UPI00289827A6|nr:helix-turn-helix domain-containing protein [Brevundimonas sp.]
MTPLRHAPVQNVGHAPLLPVGDCCSLPGVVLSYAQSEQIYAEGDRAHFLYAVVAGAVRTVRHSSDGRRQVGAFYYPGDLFGLEVDERHAFTAEAMCPAQVRSVRLGSAEDRAIAQAARRELARAHDHLAMLGRRSAEEKVASFLLELAHQGPRDHAALQMSRQDMADYLGLALETVSRVLSRFQDENLVVFSSCRDFRIIQRSRLRCLAST